MNQAVRRWGDLVAYSWKLLAPEISGMAISTEERREMELEMGMEMGMEIEMGMETEMGMELETEIRTEGDG